MFWCEYCKVWLQDNASAKATHERGMKHMDAVAKSKDLSTLGRMHAVFRSCTIGCMHLCSMHDVA